MSKKIVLLTMAGVTSLVTLDTTIVGVALPSIARSLHATFADLQWVIGGYVLCFAALLTPAGVLGDHWGRKRAVLTGVSVFAASSLLCGVAQSAALLTAARALQGVGAAFLPSAALGIIGHTYRGTERAKAFGIWGAITGLAIVSGPIIGGAITSLFGWRWTFLINIPLCIALVVVIARRVPDSRDPGAAKYDVGGAVTFAAGLFLFAWALIDSRHLLLRLLGAAIALAMFILIERRHERPMIDLELFRRPAFLGAVVAMIGYSAAAQVLMFFLPLYLQSAFGFSALSCGAAMLPFAIPLFVVPRLAARASSRRGDRVVLTSGLAVVAIGNVLLALAAPQARYWMFAVAMCVTGIGAGMLNSETVQALQGSIPPERGSTAGGLGATVRFTAILLAVAVLGAVLSRVASAHFEASALAVVPLGDALAIMRRIVAGDGVAAMAVLPAPARSAVEPLARASLEFGMSALMLAAAVIAAGSSVLSWRLLGKISEPARRSALDLVAAD